MAPSRMRRALGAVKDQTSIGLAKVGGSNSLAELEVAIVKATRHEEHPADERHIREILALTSYSSMHVITACVNTLSRRLNKTKNWTVALKTLMLTHRLLSQGDPAYEQEIFFATRRGTRFLNMSDFRDASKLKSWDYSAFVRTYALYLDERLEFKMQVQHDKRGTNAMEEHEEEFKTFSRIQHLQQLLDRFLACRPAGEAQHNRVVIVALYPMVKESFKLYYDIMGIIGILVDYFTELDIPTCVKVFGIYRRISKQLDELDKFYTWCKSIGIARSSEYPEVEKITQKKLEAMEDFIKEKSVLVKTKVIEKSQSRNEPEEETNEPVVIEEDMKSIKALPPPDGFLEAQVEEAKEEPEKEVKNKNNLQIEADFLIWKDDAASTKDYATRLALTLCDGSTSSGPPVAPPRWEAFEGGTEDWEMALVQSASSLPHQQVALPSGFNMMLLDDIYQQGATQVSLASTGYGFSGSASSVAFGSAGRPVMLALPGPSSTDGGAAITSIVDPFASSVAVAPLAYVQMADMEKKQKLMVEEQLMWQQYELEGRQGHVGLSRLQL